MTNIHQEFYESGLDLKFTSRGRGARDYYPSYRELMLEKDLTGKQCNYLVSEADFQFIKSALIQKDGDGRPKHRVGISFENKPDVV